MGMAGNSSEKVTWSSALTEVVEKAKTFEGAITSAIGVAVAVIGVVQKQPALSLAVIASLLIVAGLVVYRAARRVVTPRAGNAFVGATPFTEQDAERFFGRDHETATLVQKISGPGPGYLIFFGEPGSGKTSLLRAKVLPALKQTGALHGVYVRLYHQPLRRLREALRAVAPVEGAPPPEERPLLDELLAARARVEQPLVLCLDQFEEFFIHPHSPDEDREVHELVRGALAAPGLAKLVFSLRHDFLHRMDVFDDCAEDILEKKARVRLGMLGRDNARAVINRTLEAAQAAWGEKLVERVLDDLSIRRDGVHEEIVLPAELQIVCQMVQRAGITETSRYPGKQRLIHAYVREAIDQVPTSSEDAVQVLLALLHENRVTRSSPQTSAQVAKRSGVALSRVQVLLRRLEDEYRLVASVAPPKDALEKEVAWELAHEYLVPIILDLAGVARTPALRSRLLLDMYRSRSVLSQDNAIPIGDWFFIRRHFPGTLSPEERALLRGAVRQFMVRMSLWVLVPLTLVLGVRFSTVHFDVDPVSRAVVVRRGIPQLVPLLGSSSVLVDTGFHLNELPEAGQQACVAKLWVLDPPWARGRWGARYLDPWITTNLIAKVRNLDDNDPDNLDEIADQLLALDGQADAAATVYQERLEGCLTKFQCFVATAEALARNLRRFQEPDRKVIAGLKERFVRADWKSPRDSLEVRTLLAVLQSFDAVDGDVQLALVRKLGASDRSIVSDALYLLAEGHFLLDDARVKAEAQSHLIVLAKDPEFERYATSILGQLGDASEPVLKILRRKPLTVSALEAQMRLGVPSNQALLALIILLKTPEPAAPGVSLLSAIALGLMNNATAEDAAAAWGFVQESLPPGKNNWETRAATALDLLSLGDVKSPAIDKAAYELLSGEVLGGAMRLTDAQLRVLVPLARRGGAAVQQISQVLHRKLRSCSDCLDSFFPLLEIFAPENLLGDKTAEYLLDPALARYGCRVPALAMQLGIADHRFAPQIDACLEQSYASFPAAVYASARLVRAGEPFPQALERLMGELLGPKADGSPHYRRAVLEALATIAQREAPSPDKGKEQLAALRARLEELARTRMTHHRMAARALLDRLARFQATGRWEEPYGPDELWRFRSTGHVMAVPTAN